MRPTLQYDISNSIYRLKPVSEYTVLGQTRIFVGNIRFGFVRQSNILFGAPNICNSCNICNIWQLAGFPPQKVPKVLLHLLQLIALHAGLPS